MRIARTLSLYVMRETLVYGALCFLAVTLVVLTQNLLVRLDELVLIGMNPADWLQLSACLLPVALTRPGYAVPAKGNVPAYPDVGAIDAVAVAAPGGAVELAVVNRAPGRPIDATPAFPAPLRRVAGTQWHGGEGQAPAWQTARLPPAPPGAVLALPPGSLTLLRYEPVA